MCCMLCACVARVGAVPFMEFPRELVMDVNKGFVSPQGTARAIVFVWLGSAQAVSGRQRDSRGKWRRNSRARKSAPGKASSIGKARCSAEETAR